ncbi:hypothetical protein MCA0189 [Methylococcus capsulatus str. Bath]|uniref:Uncharacterized protein n=1 Tax=Methylococcus capsulatus (strain ATCC 33009 / NCIMB 11132 / Bath) TaxID=243233 RepID=Q60CB9_METCA|nr:hypothetical protein MCA0189 [Methylococcus capsulatus str. Bath]
MNGLHGVDRPAMRAAPGFDGPFEFRAGQVFDDDARAVLLETDGYRTPQGPQFVGKGLEARDHDIGQIGLACSLMLGRCGARGGLFERPASEEAVKLLAPVHYHRDLRRQPVAFHGSAGRFQNENLYCRKERGDR